MKNTIDNFRVQTALEQLRKQLDKNTPDAIREKLTSALTALSAANDAIFYHNMRESVAPKQRYLVQYLVNDDWRNASFLYRYKQVFHSSVDVFTTQKKAEARANDILTMYTNAPAVRVVDIQSEQVVFKKDSI